MRSSTGAAGGAVTTPSNPVDPYPFTEPADDDLLIDC
jgi:hypothetical protein